MRVGLHGYFVAPLASITRIARICDDSPVTAGLARSLRQIEVCCSGARRPESRVARVYVSCDSPDSGRYCAAKIIITKL